MNDIAEIVRDAEGDWQVRGLVARGYDLMFAPDELSDSALSAVQWAMEQYDTPFPAWQAYRVIVNGAPMFHGELVEYATGVGLAMLRSPSASVRKKGVWFVEASQDAMGKAISGSFPAPASWRAEEYGISDKTYARIRVAIAREYVSAIEDFRSKLHEAAKKVLRIDSLIR